MPPIVSFVGLSSVGKTTLLERLIPELKKRSYRVAIIKHDVHGFDMDKPGKDSWRFTQAGSDIIMISSPDKLALIKKVDHDSTLQELARLVGDSADIILTEGFKQREAAKIEVHRKAIGEKLLCKPEELVALVTDEPLDLPVWQCSTEEISRLADRIESTFLTNRREEEATHTVNGVSVPMAPFVQEFVINTLVGMVSTLKGVDKISSLDISLKRNSSGDKAA
ncbi:MAG: molybdopterin-guanine dinucleotide biosynthesis protein B [Dehalococcoidales bacterium]|nr:molybdopterin-guanine dinucleotide biosynthesis protein B [Dehalococcoidales bacterium]